MREPRHEKNLRYKNGSWVCDITRRGKRVRQIVGFTKEQAKNSIAKMRIEQLDEELGFKKPDEDVLFAEFADDFLALYSKPNKRSWRGDERALRGLKRFFEGKTLRMVSSEGISRFLAARRAEISPASCNRELACLRTLFNKAIEWGKLEMSPVAKVRRFREPPGRERILEPAEAQRLIGAASPELRLVLIIALNTGMRRAEILSLRWRAVDIGGGVINIENSKSGKSRKVPMNALVREALRALPRVASSDYVFYNPETKTHIKDVRRGFQASCARAEIKGLRLHDLRHTFATWWITAGGDLVALSKILGHASIQMTMRYAHATPEVVRLGIERVGELLDLGRQKGANPPEVVISPLRVKDYKTYL
jgi:integrase